MNAYDLRIALASLKRNPGLSALMVIAVALGIAVVTVTFTIYHAMATNPIPHKTHTLYEVTVDSWDPKEPNDDRKPEMPPQLLTYRDATALHASDIPTRSVIMFNSVGVLDSNRAGSKAFNGLVRVTYGDFFPMFDVPFQYGAGWDDAADSGPAPVIVLSRESNEKLFAGENSVGRSVSFGDREFRVVGVLDDWQPSPKFYDLNNGAFLEAEDAYVPFKWGEVLELGVAGNTNCWKSETIATFRDFLNSECVWLQLWVELPDAQARERYQAFIDNYARGQKAAGRLPRPLNNRLFNVEEWLDFNDVVKRDNRVLIGIAMLFLAVCLVNVVGLLLAKFLNGAALVGIRRALGASRKDVVRHHLAEVLIIGVLGGVLGVIVAWLGLFGIRALYSSELHDRYERLTDMDVTVVLAAIALSLLAGLVAGLYPAWRIGRTPPSRYLKTQ